MKRKSRSLKVNKRIKSISSRSKKKIRGDLVKNAKGKPFMMLKNTGTSLGTDVVIGDCNTTMGLACIICFERRQKHPMTSMWIDLDVERFTQWDLEKHLMQKHTIEELIRALAKTHWDRLTWGRK